MRFFFRPLLLSFALGSALRAAPDPAPAPKTFDTDICIYAGTSGGITAAIAAHKMGQRVLIIEPKKHIGGMTAGGLGATDVGRPMAITGLSRQFYRDVGRKPYGVFEAWTFEPHVAEVQYLHYLEQADCKVLYQRRVVDAPKRGTHITSIIIEPADSPQPADPSKREEVHAKVFIDASYEGDLMARAGVAYVVGREANSVYNETKNGVEPGPRHQFPDGVNPYIKEGDAASGLIFGVSPEPLAATGTGDNKVQAYCFRLCMTKDIAHAIPITEPDSYDPKVYELSRRLIRISKPKSLDDLLIISAMPNGKTDINSKAGQSTDFHMANWKYPDADYAERARIWKEHEEYTRGLIWFLATDEAVPEDIRMQMRAYGWPLDEYKDNHGFTHELYVREARRMVGEYIMTEQNCRSERTADDGIAFASYNMDSHHCQTVIVNGMVKNEGEVTVHLDKEYPVSYRSMTPKRNECTNLIVPVCLSSSHIAYGSIRMEPVFMALGQAAGIAASMAAKADSSVQTVDIGALQMRLQTDPYMDGRPADVHAHWSRQADRVEREGDWQEHAENAWASNEKFLRCEKPAARQRLRFKPKVETAGVYDVTFYNPQTSLPLQHGKVPVRIHSADEEKTVSYDPAAHNTLNSRTFSFGQFTFKPNAPAEIEIIADGVEIPVQAMMVSLIAKGKE
jgi:hypothetical protein